MRSSRLHSQIWRFAVVGTANTAIDLAVLNLLIYSTGMGRSGGFYVTFKAVSFMFATANSYLLNRQWTFAGASHGKRVHHQVSQFLGVSLIGLVVNVATATLFVALVPVVVVSAKLWPSVGALFGTACGLAVNFFGYKAFVFTGGKVDSSGENFPPTFA
jgi:putative flippase GtrA